MATDDMGREGLSAGARAKELGVSPAKLKKALAGLGIEPEFVKSTCGYYYTERSQQVKQDLATS